MENGKIKQIRKIIQDEMCSDEVNEYLDTLQDEIDEYKSEIDEIEKERDDLQNEVDKWEEYRDFEIHHIGLDTIYLKLGSENLEIRCRIDAFLQRLKKLYNATTA